MNKNDAKIIVKFSPNVLSTKIPFSKTQEAEDILRVRSDRLSENSRDIILLTIWRIFHNSISREQNNKLTVLQQVGKYLQVF